MIKCLSVFRELQHPGASISDLVDNGFVRLNHLIIEVVIAQTIRVRHIVYSKEYREQAVLRVPWRIIVTDIVRKKLPLNLVDKTLYVGPKAVLDNRIVYYSATVTEIVRLDVASVVGSRKEINEVRAVCRGGSREYGIPQRIARVWLISINCEVRARIGIAAVLCLGPSSLYLFGLGNIQGEEI